MSCFNITHLHRGAGRIVLISVAIRGVGKAISRVEDDWRSRSMCTETEEMPNDDESGSWDLSSVHRIFSVWLVPETTASDWWTRQSEMWWYRRFEWRCRHKFLSTARGLHFLNFGKIVWDANHQNDYIQKICEHGKLLISNHAIDYPLWIDMSRNVFGRC